jgi:hypothetical protein
MIKKGKKIFLSRYNTILLVSQARAENFSFQIDITFILINFSTKLKILSKVLLLFTNKKYF